MLPAALSPATRPVAGQAVRFVTVGGSSYLLNLGLFSLALLAGIQYLAAAAVAFAIGFVFNFLANRHWTFGAGAERAGAQFFRFTVLAMVILALDLVLLRVLKGEVGVPAVPAQAVAILLLAPVSFLGNRIWSFGAAGRLRSAPFESA